MSCLGKEKKKKKKKMPLAGTSPLSRARAHYMWAKRYNHENNLPKSIAHLDRAMAYGTSPSRPSRSPDKGVVYARAEPDYTSSSGRKRHAALFYHVKDTSIDVYDAKHLDWLKLEYVDDNKPPEPDLSLAITYPESLEWPADKKHELLDRVNDIKADVRSICKTKLRWRYTPQERGWPITADYPYEYEYEGSWIAYDDVKSCVSDLYSKWKEEKEEQERKRERKRPRKENPCVVCLTRKRSMACMPCGHLCLCKKDAPRVRKTGKCPICRTPIASLVEIK